MNSRGSFDKAATLPLILSIALLTVFIGLSKAASPQGAPALTNAITDGELVWYGLYSNAAQQRRIVPARTLTWAGWLWHPSH